MLIGLGDLSAGEIAERISSVEAGDVVDALVRGRRAVSVRIAGEPRYIAVEDAARYRDALGIPLPHGVPESLLSPVRDPLGDLVLRYARTHAPFTATELAQRFGLTIEAAEAALLRLTDDGRLLEGEFRPGGTRREWTHPEVLRTVRLRSLAKLRKEVEPVEQAALSRFVLAWQGVATRRSGADALLDVIEQLQGAKLPASILESDILPSRIQSYEPGDFDAVIAAGEVVWVGIEPLGEHDGRITLFLTDQVPQLLRRRTDDDTPRSARARSTGRSDNAAEGSSDRENAIVSWLSDRGASFFGPIHEAAGGGYPGETVDALWNLVWRGLVTNDTFHALRAFTRSSVESRRRRRQHAVAFRSRRLVPQSAEGRWSLVLPSGDGSSRPARGTAAAASLAKQETTTWVAAVAQQLLARHGVLTRQSIANELMAGGFSAVYDALNAMEERGRIRRGYFVTGLGGVQFALPGALDLLRSHREPPETVTSVLLAATDPANLYGAALPWPGYGDGTGEPGGGSTRPLAGRGPTRAVGASVILVGGALAAYLTRGDRQLLTWLPTSEPERTHVARAVAERLIERSRSGGDSPRGMLIEEIDGTPAAVHPLAPLFVEAGFHAGAMGLQSTRRNER
jgi:ATP-dependent Lhr-like helicase